MRRFRHGLLPAAVILFLVVAAGCEKREAATMESESETKSTDPQGKETVTESEVKRVGSTMVGTTETTAETEEGDKTTETRTVVGTVTEYERGKRIEVMTGNKKKHDFDLDDKDVQANVDPAVLVGTKVRLVQTEYDDGKKSVRVVPVMVLPGR